MMSVSSHKSRSFNADFSGGNRYTSAAVRAGQYSVVTLFLAKKSLTKINRCAAALSWRRNQLQALHFSGGYLLTASLRWRRLSVWMSIFTVAITVNYTSEFRWTFWSYYVHTFIHTHTHTHTYACIHTYIHIHIRTYVRTFISSL